MTSKTYSAQELLHLRHFPLKANVVKQLYESLKKDGELRDIIRIPDQALSLITEENKDTQRQSEDRLASHRATARQLDGTDSEWKYIGRTDSEHTETHPISAPTGLSAQKDEGFQRFYKAVVSPTHVRVTAGGRIVPNTRGSSSPTAKWSKERTAGDSAPSSRPQSSGQPESIPYPIIQNNLGGYPTIFPGVAPGMPSRAVPGSAQMPFMPVPFGYSMGGGYSMPPSAFNPFQATGALPTRLDSTGNNVQSETGKPKLVQISPPEQFDPSLPFYWNGHWMISQGPQIYPYGMLPPQAFTAASTNGPIMMTQGAGFNPIAPQIGPQAPQYVQGPQHQASASSSVGPPLAKASAEPPKSSIRASEITKRQIEGLRTNLKYFEDQLQYNRHQIDERYMEVQAREVRQQIQSFEKIYQDQLSSEKSQDSKAEKSKDTDSSAPATSQSRTRSGTATTSDVEFDQSSTKTLESQDKKSQNSAPGSKPGKTQLTYRPAPALNPSKSASAFPTTKLPLETPSAQPERLRKVSSLPMKAALAPPFQPRTEVNTPSSVTANAVGPTTGEAMHASALNCGGSSQWKSFFKKSRKPAQKGPPYLVGELPQGITEDVAKDTDYVYNRELTEDELRARHMYWGKTPDHLQKGLPKFDGRNFYPPSPVKGRSTDSSSISNAAGQRLCAGDIDQSPKPDNDPFQALAESSPAVLRNRIGEATQSESLPRFEQTNADLAPEITRPDSCISQIGPNYASFRKALDQTIQPVSGNSNSKSSSSEGDDDKNLIFKGRQAMIRTADKGQGAVWQNRLKKGSSSASVVPGKVSPMTAQGVLPNYSGHATASLTPTIANTTSSRGPTAKHSEPDDMRTVAEKRGENRPPVESMVDEPANGASL